jgi:hypothetical protein
MVKNIIVVPIYNFVIFVYLTVADDQIFIPDSLYTTHKNSVIKNMLNVGMIRILVSSRKRKSPNTH